MKRNKRKPDILTVYRTWGSFNPRDRIVESNKTYNRRNNNKQTEEEKMMYTNERYDNRDCFEDEENYSITDDEKYNSKLLDEYEEINNITRGFGFSFKKYEYEDGD